MPQKPQDENLDKEQDTLEEIIVKGGSESNVDDLLLYIEILNVLDEHDSELLED